MRLSRDGRGLQARSVKRTNPLFNLASSTTPLDTLGACGSEGQRPAGNGLPPSTENEAVFMLGSGTRTLSDDGMPRYTLDV